MSDHRLAKFTTVVYGINILTITAFASMINKSFGTYDVVIDNSIKQKKHIRDERIELQ